MHDNRFEVYDETDDDAKGEVWKGDKAYTNTKM